MQGCPRTDDIAPWLLGALPDDEARFLAAHVDACTACEREVDELRPAVDALPQAAPPVEPPPELGRRIMAIVEREAAERRRAERTAEAGRPGWRERLAPRPLPVLAAACALLLVGLGAGVVLQAGDDPLRTVPAAVDAPGARASLQVGSEQATLEVEGLPDAPEGRVYQVWVQRRPGAAPEPTDALFSVARDGQASVAVPADPDDVSAVLVTHEPEGGSRAPTREPVIVADLT